MHHLPPQQPYTCVTDKEITAESRQWTSGPDFSVNFERQIHRATDRLIEISGVDKGLCEWKPVRPNLNEFDHNEDNRLARGLDRLAELVSQLKLVESLKQDGVAFPSNECVLRAKSELLNVYNHFDILPYRLGVTHDESIIACFRCSVSPMTLGIEIDEDDYVAAVVSDGKNILGSALSEDADFGKLIGQFKKGSTRLQGT